MSRTYGHTYSSIEPRTRVLLDEPMMREILADVGRMRTALELELWASWILGQAWKQRTRQPAFAQVDWMLTVGAPMVAMIAEVGGVRARKALSAISLIEHGALGNYAGVIALTLPGSRTPAWMAQLGQGRFARAHHAVAPGEGEAILLDLERAGAHELSVGIFLADALDGAVSWIRLMAPDPDLFGPDSDGLAMEPLAVPAALGRLRRAFALTDADPEAGRRREIADLRAFVLARIEADGPAPAR